jgi:hypothetical protein
VKLSADRVQSLIASGHGMPFVARKGRPRRDWVAVARSDQREWDGLCEEAITFVASGAPHDRSAA